MLFVTKTWRVVQFTAAFLLIFSLTLSAHTSSQTITFSGKNIPLNRIFSEVEKQTGFVVTTTTKESFPESDKVTVHADHAGLYAFMDMVLKNKPYHFEIRSKTIFIKDRMDTPTAPTFFPSAPPLTGVIRNSDGEPLAGVNILVKGAKRGTVTGADGRYSIDVQPGDHVVISSIGFETQEFIINDHFKLDISLVQTSSKLDEVQVIAYGTQTQRLGVGNVSSVSGKDIEKQPVSNVLEALGGRVPGLFIAQSSGFSNTGVQVLIQGKNSINKGVDPFYVVDGVPYPGQLLLNLNTIGGNSNAGGGGNSLNFLNPSDIESVTVLKDADATAIYGSRAANGAILITTKKGRAGQMRVDLKVQDGWGKVAHKLKLMNNAQYLQMRHEALKNDGIDAPGFSDYDLNGTWDTTRYTDWQKVLIGNTAKYQDYSASVSGGNDLTQYLIGGTYHKETTVFPVDFPDIKASAHFSITSTSANKKFRIQMTGNYMNDYNRLPIEDQTRYAVMFAPVMPSLYNADGSINWAPNADGNSTFTIAQPAANFLNRYKGRMNNLVGNVVMSYEIVRDLNIRVNTGYTNLQSDEVFVQPLSAISPNNRPYNDRIAKYNTSNINTWIIEPQLTYKYVSGKNQLDALVGTTIQQSNSRGVQTLGIGYNSDAVMEDPVSANHISLGPSTALTYRYNALFGRISYTYADKYLVNLTGRRDGSSRFGSENRFENFGAVGLGWIFSKEDFILDAIPALSFGKLKFSYGTTGSDQIGDYMYLDLYNPFTVGVPYLGSVGLLPRGIPNPFLQWESTRKLNAGADLGFLKDRILFGVNYYRNRSSNQLLSYALPSIAGFTSLAQNFPALVQNNGWELSLSSVNIKTANFEWSTGINLTLPKNKLLRYDDLQNTPDAYSLKVGAPITVQRVFHLLGVDPATGIYQFADEHGQPTPTPNFTDDVNPLINTGPTLFGGFQNSFSYKGFSLDFLFQFMRRRQLDSYSMGDNPGRRPRNQPVYLLNAWHKPGDVAPFQRYNSDFSLLDQVTNANQGSDAAYRDASFIRLKNVSLSWSLPKIWCDKMHLSNTRVFAQGQNLLTITSYKGMDPESTGVTLPPLRVITLGLQVGL